jgi:hypothetical protein
LNSEAEITNRTATLGAGAASEFGRRVS